MIVRCENYELKYIAGRQAMSGVIFRDGKKLDEWNFNFKGRQYNRIRPGGDHLYDSAG